MLAKALILLVFFFIVVSLGLALKYLLIDGERSPRTVKALTLRISLSLVLFVLLLVGYKLGILQPHAINGANSGL